MAENNILSDLEADLVELTSFHKQATRIHVKTLLEKEVNKLTDIILIEKNKIMKKTEESKVVNEYLKTENVEYIAIKSYSWEQEGKTVKVYLTLDGIGEVNKEGITCDFEDQGFDLKIRGYKNQNLRFSVKKLQNAIAKEGCKFNIKKNSINITLTKQESKHWESLYFKDSALKFDKEEEKAEPKGDPQESMMNMMKKLYQEGDDEMKKTIAQAWTKSQEEKDKKGFK